MGVQWADESFHKRETSKWDRPKRDGGMNRDGYEHYPLMLYKANLNPHSGRFEVAMAKDVISADRTMAIAPTAEQFNTSCQLTVNDEREYTRAKDDGWSDSRAEALQFHEKLQDDIAKAAAERAHSDRNMSEKAKAEARAADDATDAHVAEVSVKPVDRMAKARAAKAAKKAVPQGA